MDCKRDELAAKIAAMNRQPFLVALTNMGEYKRALKEYGQATLSVDFSEGEFVVTVGGETVRIGEDSARFRCTCPSPVKCRHMLMAIMAVADQVSAGAGCEGEGAAEANQEKGSESIAEGTAAEKDASEGKAACENPFAYTEVDADALVKRFGAKTVEACAKKYSGSQISVKRDESLVAGVNGFTVVFLPGGSVESAVCSCKKDRCEHKCLALMRLMEVRTGKTVPLAEAELDEKTLRLIDECLDFLAGLLDKGFYAATESDAQLAMFYSLNLSLSSQALGRHLRSLSVTMDDVLQNRVYADNRKLCYHYCKAVNLLNVCKRNAGNGELLSKVLDAHKNIYVPVPVRDFISLGAHPFLADSGYAGVTHLLFDEQTGLISGLTAVLPTIYGEDSDETAAATVKRLRASVFPQAEGRRVRIYRFKEGRNVNLAASDETVAEVTGQVTKGDYRLLLSAGTDIEALRTRARVTDYLDSGYIRDYAMVPFERMDAAFDETAGVSVVLLTGRGGTIETVCPYNAVTRVSAERLERAPAGKGLAVVSRYGGEYRLLTLFCGGRYVDLYF